MNNVAVAAGVAKPLRDGDVVSVGPVLPAGDDYVWKFVLVPVFRVPDAPLGDLSNVRWERQEAFLVFFTPTVQSASFSIRALFK